MMKVQKEVHKHLDDKLLLLNLVDELITVPQSLAKLFVLTAQQRKHLVDLALTLRLLLVFRRLPLSQLPPQHLYGAPLLLCVDGGVAPFSFLPQHLAIQLLEPLLQAAYCVAVAG